MGKKKKTRNSRQRKKQRRRLEALKSAEAQGLTEDPLADIEAEEEDAEEVVVDESDEEAPVSDEVETQEKSFVPWGVTSYEEFDAVQEAAEKAEKVREAANVASQIVDNIIWDDEIEPDEKAKEIKQVADEMSSRMSAAISTTKEKAFDFEIESLLSLKSYINNSVGKRISDGVENASAGVKDLPDEAFAYIDEDGKRYAPLTSKALVRDILRVTEKAVKKGKDQELIDALRQASPKIKEAAKKFGIGQPSEENPSGIIVEKDLNGDYRWTGWATNKYIDRDKQIITDAAHKEFCDWLTENPEMAPVFMTWHTKGTIRERPVDAWVYENGFMLYSGLLTEKEAQGLIAAGKENVLGMSHGFIGISKDGKHITKYRTYEVSDLPLDNAANPYTNLEIISKEAVMADKKDHLEKVLGKERVEKLMENAEFKAAMLDEGGVESKSKTDEQELPPVDEQEDVEPENTEETPQLVPENIAKMIEDLEMDELSEWVEETDQRVKAMEETLVVVSEALIAQDKEAEDELADMISGNTQAKAFSWSKKRASQSGDNVLNEDKEGDKKLKESTPGLGDSWLSDVTGTAPLE